MSLPVAPAEPMRVAGRLARLRALLPGAQCEGLLVTELANVRYLTGFSGSAGILLVTAEEALLVTDGRYRTQAAEQLDASGAAGDVELVIGNAVGQRDALVSAVGRSGSSRLGLEADSVTWSAQRRWQGVLGGVETVPTGGVVEALRLVKDEAELDRMAYAAALADVALGEVRPLITAGRSEAALALALDSAMRRLGAEDRAFETIVASGPNAAKPHARPSGRQLEDGDAVVVDFGAVYDGYRSDMTRTFFVGGVPAGTMARVLEVVSGAQRRGVETVRAGVATGEVDRVCREAIAEAGFGEAFEHGTGHGVGLDVHEAPAVGPGTTAILGPGVVVTVEPGVYLAGVGGVRVEDTVVVTEDGCRVLTCYPKEPAA